MWLENRIEEADIKVRYVYVLLCNILKKTDSNSKSFAGIKR